MKTLYIFPILLIGWLMCPAQSPFSQAHPGLQARATGTGRTTGHIADLVLLNTGSDAIQTEIGPLLIPSTEKNQGYVVNDSYPVTIPALGTATVALHGYCTDIALAPLPAGAGASPVAGWIVAKRPFATPGPGTNLVSMGYESISIAEEETILLTYPGTTIPFTFKIDIAKHSESVATLLITTVDLIEEACDRWMETSQEIAVFEGAEKQEVRNALVQHTFWYYTARLQGRPYTREYLTTMVIQETETVVNSSSENYTPFVNSQIETETGNVWDAILLVGVEAKVIKDDKTPDGSWSLHYQQWMQEETNRIDPRERDAGYHLAFLADTLDGIATLLGARYMERIRNAIAVKLGDHFKIRLGQMKVFDDVDEWADLEDLTRTAAFKLLDPGAQEAVKEMLRNKLNEIFLQKINALKNDDIGAWLDLDDLSRTDIAAAYLSDSTRRLLVERRNQAFSGQLLKGTAGLDPSDEKSLEKWFDLHDLTKTDWFVAFLPANEQADVVRILGEKFTQFLHHRLDELNPADTSMLVEWMKIETLILSDWFTGYVSESAREEIIRKLKEKFTAFLKEQISRLDPTEESMLKKWHELETLVQSNWFTEYVSEADKQEIIRRLKEKFTAFVKKRLEELDPKDPEFLEKWRKLESLTRSAWFGEYMEEAQKPAREMDKSYRQWEKNASAPVDYAQLDWKEVQWTGWQIKYLYPPSLPEALDRGMRPWLWIPIIGVPVAGGITYAILSRTPPPQANPDAVNIACPGSATVSVLANDTGKDIRIVSITQPSGATVIDQGFGNLLITLALTEPSPAVAFSYTIEDFKGRRSTAQVTATISFPSITATDDVFDGFAGTPIAANVLANDAGQGLTVSEHTTPEGGTFSMSPNGSFSYVPQPGFCESATFTYTITDACSQMASATAVINLTDNKPPAITCPPAFEIPCGENPDPSITGLPEVSDNCTPPSEITLSNEDEMTGTGCVGDILRTWTATDAAGNTSSCEQLILVVDLEAPAIVCPPNITVICGNEFDLAITGQATGTDNCSGTVSITFTDDLSGYINCEGVIIRTWTAVDPCGNAVFCTQSIFVEPPGCNYASNVNVLPDLCVSPGEIILTLNGSASGVYQITVEGPNSFILPLLPSGEVFIGEFGFLPPGEYTLLVTDPEDPAGCVQTLVIVIPGIPPYNLLVTGITPPSSPSSNDGIISLSVSGGPPPPLLVFVNGELVGTANIPNFSLTNVPEGTYEIWIIAANECESSPVTVTLEAPPGFAGLEMPLWAQDLPPMSAGLSYRLNKNLQLRWQIQCVQGRAGQTWIEPGTGAPWPFETSFRAMTNEGGFRYYLPRGRVAPFMGAGLQWHRLSFANNTLQQQTVSDPGLRDIFSSFLSTGMRWDTGKGAYLELEGRMTNHGAFWLQTGLGLRLPATAPGPRSAAPALSPYSSN